MPNTTGTKSGQGSDPVASCELELKVYIISQKVKLKGCYEFKIENTTEPSILLRQCY